MIAKEGGGVAMREKKEAWEGHEPSPQPPHSTYTTHVCIHLQLITYGDMREEALTTMAKALDNYCIKRSVTFPPSSCHIDLMQYSHDQTYGHWTEIRILCHHFEWQEDCGLWNLSTAKHFASSLHQ